MRTRTYCTGPHLVRYLSSPRAILWAGGPSVGVFTNLVSECPEPGGLLIVHTPEGGRYEIELSRVRSFPVVALGFGEQYRVPFGAMRHMSGPPVLERRKSRKRRLLEPVLPLGGSQ